MTTDLLQTIRRIIQQELATVRTTELGVVESSYPHASDSDKDGYACDVKLRNAGLVLKAVPVATQRVGAVNIPAPGELVVVQFLDGDLQAPVIMARLYTDQARPPLSDDADHAVLHLPLDAGDSDAVHAELRSGSKRELSLKLGDGLSLTLRDDDPAVELSVDGGKAQVRIDRDGAVSVKSNAAIKFEGSEITLEASGKLTLKGSTVNIN